MAAPARIAQPGAGRVIATFMAEHAFKHEDLLAAWMHRIYPEKWCSKIQYSGNFNGMSRQIKGLGWSDPTRPDPALLAAGYSL